MRAKPRRDGSGGSRPTVATPGRARRSISLPCSVLWASDGSSTLMASVWRRRPGPSCRAWWCSAGACWPSSCATSGQLASRLRTQPRAAQPSTGSTRPAAGSRTRRNRRDGYPARTQNLSLQPMAGSCVLRLGITPVLRRRRRAGRRFCAPSSFLSWSGVRRWAPELNRSAPDRDFGGLQLPLGEGDGVGCFDPDRGERHRSSL